MYSINWIVKNRIMLVRYQGTLSGDEIKAVSKKFTSMMETAVAPLHVIEDDRELEEVSGLSLNAIRDAFSAIDTNKLETAVAIMPDSLGGVADVLGKAWELLSDINYHRVDTLPEALDYLAQHDATLPDRSEWKLELA